MIKSITSYLWIFFNRLNYLNVGQSILSVFGALWLIVEILSFFGKDELSNNIKALWWVFLIIGIIFIIYYNRPITFYKYKVHNRDVSISIQIGDIFKKDAALIIPINSKLDCINNGVVQRSNSILRFFIDKYYNKTASHLKSDIENQLEEENDWYSNYLSDEEQKIYKIGTVLPIYRNEKQFYLLASSNLNEQGRSKTTSDDLRKALIELWSYLTIKGSKDNLIMPIIGTGRGRISLTREEVIKEIVLSFLASLSQDSYCEQLIISIHPTDLKEYNIKLDELLDFIKLNCNNTSYIQSNDIRTGTGIGA